jgi:hypothetical protein
MVPVVEATTDGGLQWSLQALPSAFTRSDQEAADISCPTAEVCVATQDEWGQEAVVTTDGGAHWTAQALPSEVSSLSCPSASECWALPFNAGTSAPAIWQLALSESGDITSSPVALPAQVSHVSGLYCSATSNCVASGFADNSQTVLLAGRAAAGGGEPGGGGGGGPSPTTTTTVPTTTTTAATATTTVPTTTTTAPSKSSTVHPTITGLTRTAVVSHGAVDLKLHCSNAACSGTIKLWDNHLLLGKSTYSLAAAKTASFTVRFNSKAMALLSRYAHRSLRATETVLVTGGERWTARIGLAG